MAIIGAHPERGIRFILERNARLPPDDLSRGESRLERPEAAGIPEAPESFSNIPVASRPASVRRIEIAPTQAYAPPYRYEGFAFTAKEKHRLVVDVLADGTVDIGGDAPDDIQDKTRLLMRMFVRHAESEGTAPPRRILRWRPDA
ncbi:hypothetical protein LVJ94_19950 [Pendulispora rubella]|uniref:Uncharacterized protein n=1 Tax=Pendulispora rubella TaxID=2741070 RepID=A0ABZ2LK18_9BACT